LNLDIIRNIGIEQHILGSMIIDLNSILAVRKSGASPEDFYEQRHKVIFNAINQIFKEYNKADLILLTDFLTSKDLISKAGGITYITALAGSIESTCNINSYVDRLLQYSCKRRIISLSNYIKANEGLDNEKLKTEIHKRVLDLFDSGKPDQKMQEAGEAFLISLEKRYKGEAAGIKTGLNTLDDITGGMSPGELITLFAFSSVGKTTLALQMAINIIRENKRVLYFSLEMSEEQLIERLNGNLCSINSRDLRNGNLTDKDWCSVTEATGWLCMDNRLNICRDNTLFEIITKIQLEKLKNNIDIVFVDYIGLIEAPREERRDLQIANITRKLKLLAGELNIPIVILAQAKQSTYEKNGKAYRTYEKISETDIGESGAIFKDSDKVIAMYRNIEMDDPMARKAALDSGTLDYNSKDAMYNPDCVNLLVKKCRNGTKGSMAFRWEGQYYRISNW
jgi:replicative DNA helicase